MPLQTRMLAMSSVAAGLSSPCYISLSQAVVLLTC